MDNSWPLEGNLFDERNKRYYTPASKKKLAK
jgi:hypothetical protein